MSQENPTIDDFKQLLQTELSCLVGEIGSTLGTELGNLQKQLDLISGADTAALAEFQAQVTNLVAMLDGDANTPGMQNLTALLGLIDRVQALEEWRSGVDDQISQFTSTFSSIEQRIAAVEQSGAGGGNCDCAQIATDIQALRDSIVTLQGVDAAQAQQLLTLAGRVDGLVTQLDTLAEQLAGMATAIATAGGNAQQALEAAQAAQNAVNTLRDREDTRHTEHGNAIGMIRNQLYGMTVGLCDAIKPGFASAFAAAKSAALAA